MMASRGMMPLAPADQVSVLYQLSLDGDTQIASAARTTAAGLPDKLLGGTLSDARLDARVLDFFAAVAGTKLAVFEAIVDNAATADETIVALATKGDARAVDRIAGNEQRLLRHPEIIGAMYMNKHARMSTVDRVVELAVRNQIRVPNLAVWDEVARALAAPKTNSADAEADALFAYAAEALTGDDSVLTNGDAEAVVEEGEELLELDAPEEVKISIAKMAVPAKIRLATLGDAFARNVLIRDPMRMVAVAAIKAPGVTEIEAARYAANQTLAEDVIRYIANKREWTKRYGVKVALCRNAKTPIPDAARLMPFLRERELMNLSRSKGVSSALVAQARKLMMQRRGGTEKKS
jgi:hypothetical protein